MPVRMAAGFFCNYYESDVQCKYILDSWPVCSVSACSVLVCIWEGGGGPSNVLRRGKAARTRRPKRGSWQRALRRPRHVWHVVRPRIVSVVVLRGGIEREVSGSIYGHRAMPAQDCVVPPRAVVPAGPCLTVLRA